MENITSNFNVNDGSYSSCLRGTDQDSGRIHGAGEAQDRHHHRHRAGAMIDNLITTGKANCLLGSILGATLFASVLNTLLLSLLIKSIQLNDAGLLNGQINWDKASESSTLNVPTKLEPTKSIHAKTIQSTSSDGHLKLQLNSLNDRSFLATPIAYLATSAATSKSEQQLQIGAKLIELYLEEPRSDNKWLPGTATTTKLLLSYNDPLETVTMPLETKLNLNPSTSGSLVVNDRLKSSEIIGTLERDLDIQTRGGKLHLSSEDNLELVSKSAQLELTTGEEFLFRGERVMLSSLKGIHLDGIRYFEDQLSATSFEADSSSDGRSENSDLMAYSLCSSNGILVAAS